MNQNIDELDTNINSIQYFGLNSFKHNTDATVQAISSVMKILHNYYSASGHSNVEFTYLIEAMTRKTVVPATDCSTTNGPSSPYNHSRNVPTVHTQQTNIHNTKN